MIFNFAYDSTVELSYCNDYVHNYFNNKWYPKNGNNQNFIYDYFIPIQTIFEKNGYKTNEIDLNLAISENKPFIYVLTFRDIKKNLQKNTGDIFKNLPAKLVEQINNDKCIFVLNDSYEFYKYDFSLISLLIGKLIYKGINFRKVLMVTGINHNTTYNHIIPIVFWQSFETSLKFTEYKNKGFQPSKKFLCMNRQKREHRYYFINEIYKRNLLKDFNISLNSFENIDEIRLDSKNIFLPKLRQDKNFQHLQNFLPLTIDTQDFTSWNFFRLNDNLKNLGNIYIGTETLFSDDVERLFITEKTFKPILCKLPFIIVGQPYTLKKLQELGYQTFSDLWDESYDTIIDPMNRMHKICDLVESLSQLPNCEFEKILQASNEVLEHNYTTLRNSQSEKKVLETIIKKYSELKYD